MIKPIVSIVETPEELQRCFEIRTEVFVNEQKVPKELELDALDDKATHFLMRLDDQQIGTARLLDKNGCAKIGRVAILREFRGLGYGAALMNAIIHVAETRGFVESVLDAQTYAVPFYKGLGYEAEGDEFDDAGIPHFHMKLRLLKPTPSLMNQ